MSQEVSLSDIDRFEGERARLQGLAYRLLGSISEAEDVVQDTWIKWQATDRESLEVPEAWLTTVATRLALDRLRSARSRREGYPGPWLPEPLVVSAGPEELVELADNLTLGFLILLDQLEPLERAVFVLADVFDTPFAEIASAVGRSEVACRQIASRARRRVRRGPSPNVSLTRRRQALDGLVAAIASGDIDQVIERLAPDVVCISDGGPKRRAARYPVVGAPRVARLLVNLAKRHAAEGVDLTAVNVNGDPGLLIYLAGQLDQVMAVEVNDGLISAIRLLRNPDKLTRVEGQLQPGGSPAIWSVLTWRRILMALSIGEPLRRGHSSSVRWARSG